jgi:hypothetical protein
MASRYLTDRWPIVDAMTNAKVGITYEHHELHEGDSFVLSVTDGSMAGTEYIGLAFITPASPKRVHMVAEWATLGVAHSEIIEGAVVTGGTAAVPFNRNRANITASAVTSCKTYDSAAGDTIGGGVTIHSAYAYSAKNQGSEGGRDAQEIILAPQTTYAFKAISDAGGGAITISLHWYEHTDSNA